MRYRQGESRRDSFGVRKEKENEPWVLRFSTLCLRMSECRNAGAERERERWRPGNRGASVLSAEERLA
jgi:hypothetical protein